MTSPPSSLRPAEAHVLLVGAGGIGCPAAWALTRAGVGRLTIADPDRVETSNLPRQVLFGPADLGRPKADVAAERVRAQGGEVRGRAARLDETTEEDLLRDVDLLLDATDGALAKDWINALAVRRRLPLVHAAGLRSEGRLLDVPAGGRPCLACLFGRLEEERGTCADLGVWGTVVGAVGFLAADLALWRLARPSAPSRGYVVLDLETGRGAVLRAEASSACPVCAGDAPPSAEPYPVAAPCEDAATPDAADGGARPTLDLVGEECPMNLLRARRALEGLPPGAVLEIRLGPEGERTVPEGLTELGHEIVASRSEGSARRLAVRRGARRERSGP